MILRTDFDDRDELVAYCVSQFPEAAAVSTAVSATRGGRAPAQERLDAVDPVAYGRTRNSFDGAVTRLSPYLRHGVLGLADTIQFIKQHAGSPQAGYKLLQELAWRDYWRRVLDKIGDEVWEDREPYKTGYDADDYADGLPTDCRRTSSKHAPGSTLSMARSGNSRRPATFTTRPG